MHWSHLVLFGVCALAYWQGHEPIRRAALAFTVNGLIITAYKLFINPWGDPVLQLAVDAFTAAIILRDPADRELGWLGMILGIRIGASLAFVQSGVPAAQYDYWSFVNFWGLALLAGLFLWSEWHGGKIIGLASRIGRLVLGRLSVRHSN